MSDPYAFDDAEVESIGDDDDEDLELDDDAEADEDDPWTKTAEGDDEV